MENTAIEKEAMHTLSYGLFMLSVGGDGRDNGCIVNTVSMLTENPRRITVYVNKLNYTEQLLRRFGTFNVSVLTESVPFDVIKQFGFCSGKDTYKFAGREYPRTTNGIFYLPEHTNAVISAKVTDMHDYGSHTLFVAEVTAAKKLSDEPSVTYDYYYKHIKPSPTAPKQPENGEKKKRWVCKVCGYVYEGDELPADYICPLCKHGAEDFELVE